MKDISKELRIILSQIPSMRQVLRDYYRGSEQKVNEDE